MSWLDDFQGIARGMDGPARHTMLANSQEARLLHQHLCWPMAATAAMRPAYEHCNALACATGSTLLRRDPTSQATTTKETLCDSHLSTIKCPTANRHCCPWRRANRDLDGVLLVAVCAAITHHSV
jgi:hypothetical protein